ncbi:related to Ras GTPase-activating-like protein IQGAP2 [Sporisorium scitamineum]|uniref:Related to Ras GTPase-activating-like protein IQGAP2 n=1 Tax=Sporisorium scitamineum TaxID=49012 RepID=A0A127ZBN7_9BASI|nr:related to Ras GTPase-activating-like protein IQGAP2 [Sporisorium scitamineum]
MMDQHAKPTLPAASPNARGSPFAYQSKYLDRSTSRSSTFSLASPLDSTARSPTATGLQHSGSVRRFPAPHRHTASLDPQRAAELRAAAAAASPSAHSPTASPHNPSSAAFGSNHSLASSDSNHSVGTTTSPVPATFSKATFPASSRGVNGRPISMPPAPRDNLFNSSTVGRARAFSPTKDPYDRAGSPTKNLSHDSPLSSPKKDDASWIQSPSTPKQGSFWSNGANGINGGSSAGGPSQLHLGGVKDLKRSSVGALKMIKDFTQKTDDLGALGDQHGHTRMTVGRSRGQRPQSMDSTGAPLADRLNGLNLEPTIEEGWQKPGRPGRMESEDQEGEIVLPGITTGAEDVAGLQGRIRLARADGPGTMALGRPSATSSSSLPFTSSSKWMDTQRHLLQAYEYLCHCGEAKEWMELHVGEHLGHVVEMENEMRDGIFLAKLAKTFEPECVPRIFVHPKLQYRHTDNINYFFSFINKVGLPHFFQFELTDLYEKKNFPKVVYCIHALSHVLARQGRALKVGNLIGKLEFTDDQLQKTQKGLDASGVAMPSFGGVGKALAKEMNIEPEPEPETEQERIDRELMENIDAVVAMQTASRAFVARMRFADRLQAEIQRRHEEEARLAAAAEAERVRQRRAEEDRVVSRWTPPMQAQIRGVLARRTHHRKQAALYTSTRTFVGLQAAVRARLARQTHVEHVKRVHDLDNARAIEKFQACARGALYRRRFFEDIKALDKHETGVVGLQAQIRGRLARAAYENLIYRLADSTEDVIKLQAACRSVLAKQKLLGTIRGLRSSSDAITALQAQIRGVLARKNHVRMRSALQKVEVKAAVGGLQSFARAALARRKHQEQKKQLDFVTPDVVGIQAAIRGMLVRLEYDWWRNHIIQSEPVAIHLQSLIRGALSRRKFFSRLRHYHEHMDKVVKIQSLFRGRQQGEQYRSLTMGKNVPVATIKNFGHLLNDSDADFEDEIEVERLRKLVVRAIRESQTLENDVSELDTKIALLVKNKIGIEELIKAKNERGLLGQREAAAAVQKRNSVLVAANDPFADHALDRASRRKFELYQELFYALQTRPEYLARLFARVGKIDMADRDKRQVEKIVLTLFGYAQKAREEFLLLKLFQRCVEEELGFVSTVQEFIRGNAQFIKLVAQYNRGARERKYLKDLLSPLVQDVMAQDGLDLETDPCAIYRATINQEEMETGQPSRRPLEVAFNEALADPMARTIFIRHLQSLRATTETFLSAILASTRKMPYGVRYIAREVFRALQAKFPNEPEDALIKVVGHLVYYRYLNPAIVAPEGFDVVESLVGPMQRKNLAEVSKMLTQIAVGRLFNDDNPYLQPLNDYVSHASERFTKWLYGIIDCPDAEMQFSADEFLDHTVQQKPVIYISPNEIYSMHLLLSQQVDHLAPNQEDPLRVILKELGAAPVSNTQELNSARDSEITFELVSRMATLQDPEAETKALFVETKRLVLSLLKVQSGKTLVDVFVAPVTDREELQWEEIVSLEIAADRQRQRGQRPPGVPMYGGATGPGRLEDVRRLSFAELKARTLENMLQLERLGKVSRANKYQDMLNAIAIDIRNKHRKRIQRANEKAAMHTTLKTLGEKKAYLEEQINSYHSYIDASMQTMQGGRKGKKRFVLPFSQQYFHLRSLKQNGGKVPKFGSYKYAASKLVEKGVLVKIDGIVKQAGVEGLSSSGSGGVNGKTVGTNGAVGAGGQAAGAEVSLTISSDQAGVFTIDVVNGPAAGLSTDLRIEDLLESQFNNQPTLSVLDGAVEVNVNLLVHLINKKFYA